jgi:chemotaxis methyl-accepting protein methylase
MIQHTLPREEIRPAWRAAVQAYRREYEVTREDRFAREAAFEAFREVLPDMPEEQAKAEANHAIAYAAANHTEWFWRGV